MKELFNAVKTLNANLVENESNHSCLEFDSQNLLLQAKKMNLTPALAKNLSSQCWDALVSLSRLPRIPDNYASICAKLIDILQLCNEQVKIDTVDLNKLIANLSIKMFSGHSLPDDYGKERLEFLAKSFERLHESAAVNLKDEDELASSMNRRLSIQHSIVEGIQYKISFPSTPTAYVLKQCYSIALDCLIKIFVVRKELLPCFDELVECFLTASSSQSVLKLLSWCCKLEAPITQNEWLLWCRVVDEGSLDADWDTLIHFYGKRSIERYWKGPLELIAPLTHLPLEDELISDTFTKQIHCSAFSGLLSRIVKCQGESELAQIYEWLCRNERKWKPPSVPELKALLTALDDLRNTFFHFVKSETALRLFTVINRTLIAINLPEKYASAWGTQLLKAIQDARPKYTTPVKTAVTSAIELLLARTLDSEFREKTIKVAAQTVSWSSSVQLFRKLLQINNNLLSVVLDHFVEGVENDFMEVVSEAVIASADDDVLVKSWIRALSLHTSIQQIPKKNIPFSIVKAISLYILDDVKAERYLESIWADWSEEERQFVFSYLALLNPSRRPQKVNASLHFPILDAIKNNSKLVGPVSIRTEAELDAHFHYLQQCLKRGSEFMNELNRFKDVSSAFIPVFRLFNDLTCNVDNRFIAPIHSIYLSGENKAALKTGYDVLKRIFQNPFDSLQVCTYLHRLACISGAVSEASWFLRQATQLIDGSEAIEQFVQALKRDFDILTSRDNCFDYQSIEGVLGSDRFSIFSRERRILANLQEKRKTLPSLGYFCTGFKKPKQEKDIPISCTTHSLDYFNIFQAKLDLHLQIASGCRDWSRLFHLFHLGLGYQFPLSSPKGKTFGILCDWAMDAMWILSSVPSAKEPFLLFRFPIDTGDLLSLIRKFTRVSQANTETLKNTAEIAADPNLRADWWRRRKELNAELEVLTEQLDSLVFSRFTNALLPSSSSVHVQATNLAQELKSAVGIDVSDGLAEKLVALGSFPTRPAAELLLKLAGVSGEDDSIATIRKCFHNALELGSIFHDHPIQNTSIHCNLLLDKTLTGLPWESFPSLRDKASFRRVLVDAVPERSLQSVFYIINPSGDLVKTQERFKELFESQSDWKGIIGRKPSSDEFLKGIVGEFDLFIYFGHAGGEIYAPLHELKRQIRKDNAAAALLVGCSSGRIKVNGIFAPQSSVFYYLENSSPLVLAALWDVTDKDIDTYIRNVMEKSGLLDKKATLAAINEQAHANRSSCFLKALNGYAPVVYGPVIK